MVTHAQPAPARNGTGQWWPSKYGSGDQAGALNEITPGKVLEAVRLVRRGRLYDLAHVLHHLQEGDRTYNGFLLADIIEDHGTNRLGIDTLPQVVTRGLLLDVAAARGGERLGPGEVITVADAENALASTGHEVRPGDAVFFHTGWGSLWGTDNERYAAGEPGPGRALGQWLADHQPETQHATGFRMDLLRMSLTGPKWWRIPRSKSAAAAVRRPWRERTPPGWGAAGR